MGITVTAVAELLLIALTIWRFTILLHRETGPFHIFDWLRFKAGVKYMEVMGTYSNDTGIYDVKVERQGEGFFAELFNCPYCLSFWVSITFFPLLLPYAFPNYTLPVLISSVYSSIILFGGIWGLATILLNYSEKD